MKNVNWIPISGLQKEVNFRLEPTQLPALRWWWPIRLRVSDYAVASALEELLCVIRKRGFPFDHPTIGHGLYATSICTISGLRFLVILDRLGKEGSKSACTLRLSAFRTTEGNKSVVCSGAPRVLPTETEFSLWERLADDIEVELVRTLSATDIECSATTHTESRGSEGSQA